MNGQEVKSSGDEVSSAAPETSSSPAKRRCLDDSGNVESEACDETASGNENMDPNSSTINSDSSPKKGIPEGPLEMWEILSLMGEHAMKSPNPSNSLEDFPSKTDRLDGAAHFPFVVESSDPASTPAFLESLRKMNDAEYVDYDKNRMDDGFMFDAQRTEIVVAETSYEYTEEQVKCYKDMKEILETETFHVCLLTGESGTGKTICLKQFCDDPDIDFVYVALQNSLCKEASQKLSIPFGSTMTLTRLSMIIFGISDGKVCIKYQNALKLMTEKELKEIGLPTLFKVPPEALNQLIDWSKNQTKVKPTSDDSQKLILCIGKFNVINSNELFMIKNQLKRLVSASEVKVNVILLFCGVPSEIQPVLGPSSPKKVDGFSTDRNFLSENSISIMELAQTRFEFQHAIRSDNPEYKTFLKNLKNSTNFGDDVLQGFGEEPVEEEFKVRKIPYQYCLQSLLDLPAPSESNPNEHLGASYERDVAAWVQKYSKDFNGVTYYAYKNAETHYMNLSIYLCIWQQCQLFNKTAAQNGHQQIPQHLMPRLAKIYFVNPDRQLVGSHNERLERTPVLPLIIGWRYKVLSSEDDLKLGEMVTLVHVQYEDSSKSYKTILHLRVVTPSGALVTVKRGLFYMNLFQEENPYSLFPRKLLRGLYGFPLQLAFARTIRGSLGSTVEGDIYCNLTFFSREEVLTLLPRIQDPCQIKGLAWIK